MPLLGISFGICTTIGNITPFWLSSSPAPRSIANLFRSPLRRNGKCRTDISVRVVHLEVISNQLLLSGLVSQVASDQVAVFFGLQDGDQVDAGPHLFAGKFAISSVSDMSEGGREW